MDFSYIGFNSLAQKADKTHTHDERYFTESEIKNNIFVAQADVSFINGVGKYSNSKISSSYICLFNRNNSVVSTGTTTPQSSSCGNGYVNLVFETKVSSTYTINMIFIKKIF